MVDGIREELCFKRKTFAISQRFAAFAVAFAVEEIAAVELQTDLVAPNL